jgi:hypothetical protein
MLLTVCVTVPSPGSTLLCHCLPPSQALTLSTLRLRVSATYIWLTSVEKKFAITVGISDIYRYVSFRSPSLFYLLVHSRCRGCLFSFDHTQPHTTVGRTPPDEGSARRRDLYLTTQTLYKRQTSMPPPPPPWDSSPRFQQSLGRRPTP